MKMELLRNCRFKIKSKVFINLPDGEEGKVIGYVVYSSHIEYIVLFQDGIRYMLEDSITEEKIY